MNNPATINQILQTISEKSVTKQQVFDKTLNVFNQFKAALVETEKLLNNQLVGVDHRVHLEYRDNGKFEAQLKVAGDLLIISMHSNAFEFNRDHAIWNSSFVKHNKMNTYSGIIHIYNFLNDSFRYHREEDLGYLIARVFVNKDGYFMVEGKRQLGLLYNMFSNEPINSENIIDILNNVILYALEFDLLVPPYDNVKIATVEQMEQNIENSKMQTGKRLGFKFNSDDVGSSK